MLHNLSATAYDWLTSKQSLTTRLREFTNNKIQHHLFYNDWGIAPEISRQTLNLSNEKTWIREMEWQYENQTWMHCTVVIPESSMNEELFNLKNRSIGEILFEDPTLKRSDYTFYKIGNNVTRHSIFYFKEKPLLIIEIFFPAFFEVINDHRG